MCLSIEHVSTSVPPLREVKVLIRERERERDTVGITLAAKVYLSGSLELMYSIQQSTPLNLIVFPVGGRH